MLGRVFMIEPVERPAAAWSFACFFLLLSGYYVLRPVRDAMGIESGVHNLPWLFSGTFVAMLAAVPLFGWAAARWRRGTLLPAVYGFFAVHLVLFYAALRSGFAPTAVAGAFFIWVSVYNLFVVSLFWSFMVDVFDDRQAKRLFGFVAAGGSAGALAGPALAALLVTVVGTATLLLLSAAFLIATLVCFARIDHWTRHAGAAQRPRTPPPAVGGAAWAGIKTVAASPYLLGICLYIVLTSLLATLVYFEQARIVGASLPSSEQRTALFATLDLAVNILALLLQVFATAPLLRRFGVAIALVLLPAVTLLGFGFYGVFPALLAMAAFQVVRRATEYAIARPAREMLFVTVAREQKYKSKNFIDTVVYRGGDAFSGWVTAAFGSAGFVGAKLALVAIPAAAIWMLASWLLGRTQQAMLPSVAVFGRRNGEVHNDHIAP
jgi:AAA family ATP:ADP antiporter